MEARRISQRAVKNMINGNTALLHIGNFDTGKRTGLKRAVSEWVGCIIIRNCNRITKSI